ncbi:MAG: hypothetical protein Q9227_004268 [Pyrenula ochraceoflavens]
MFLLTLLVTLLASLNSNAAVLPRQSNCVSQSQPNPIAAQYPNEVTGTINGTFSIIPIPYAQARALVPPQFKILTKAYQTLIPQLNGAYPLLLLAVFDSGIQSSGITIPNFSRATLNLPFVDLLNDGHSSFRYQLGNALNSPLAVAGASIYGPPAGELATFNPPCNAYASTGGPNGEIRYTGYDAVSSKQIANTLFHNQQGNPFSVDVFKNLTNQPIGNALLCDQFISFFNTSITQGQFAPVSVRGTVNIAQPLYPLGNQTFQGIWGYKADLAFLERNAQSCAKFANYQGTGPGD